MSSVEFRQVSKSFGAIPAVAGVSFELRRGEFFSLLGPSGCGKTTTLRLLAGFEEPDAGEILISGAAVRGTPPYERRLGMVFQSYALFPHLSVERNVAYGLERRRMARGAMALRVAKALELVRLAPEEYSRRRPAELSGGERQRVALARALVLEPQLLLLDEPLGALDLQLRKAMQLELKQLNRALGITFVHVTHDQEEALTMSDRIAVMDRGRIEQIGAPAELYEHPRTAFVAGFIGESNLLPGGTPDGRRVAVRPERIELLPPGVPPPHCHALLATVAEVSYLGDRVRIQVVAGDGARLTATVPARRLPLAWSLGEQVLACWRPEDGRLLEEP